MSEPCGTSSSGSCRGSARRRARGGLRRRRRDGSATTSAARGTPPGTGTFLGGEGRGAGDRPSRGRSSASPELRVETVVPAEREAGGRRRAARRRIRTRSSRSTSTRSWSSSVKARLSTDGGARGNPGPAAYGYVLEAEDGTVLAAHGETIGVATNNVAEYRALIAGPREGARAAASTSSRSSPTPSCSSSRCAASTG